MILGVDIETCSAADIDDGASPYAEHPSTRVYCMVFGFSRQRGDVDLLRWHPWLPVPHRVEDHICASLPVLAHNAPFEASIFHYILNPQFSFPRVNNDQWEDTLAMAAALNLPLALGNLGPAIGANVLKDEEGRKLMRKMADVKSKNGKLVYPVVTKELLERLTVYCERDVLSMVDCYWKLPKLSPDEAAMLREDRRINARGALLDLHTAAKMREMAVLREQDIGQEVFLQTQEIISASDPKALLSWVRSQGVALPKVVRKKADGTFHATESIDRASIAEILERPDVPVKVRNVLLSRIECGRLTSLAKAARAPVAVNKDGRLRYAFRYSKAITGRWSSEILQLHNLAKPTKEFKQVREAFVAAVNGSDIWTASKTFSVLEGLSFMLRSLVVAPPGRDLIGGDFSAIEARVAAWVAGQEDSLEVYRKFDATEGQTESVRRQFDPYVLAAAEIKSDNRQLGKVRELALQYQMGAIKFRDTAADWGVAIDLKTANQIMRDWRKKKTAIVGLWKDLEAAFRGAIAVPGEPIFVGAHICFIANKECLKVMLPSGRAIHYWRPHTRDVKRKIETVDDDGNIVTVEVERNELRYFTPAGKQGMEVESTYGGKLCVAAGTLVLTEQRGWQQLRHIRFEDRVHDGVEFVDHGGILFNGYKECVTVDGVWMTPDHEVLTDDGWQEAASLVSRPHRPSLRGVTGARCLAEHREEVGMAFSVRLRADVRETGRRRSQGSEAGRQTELRMPNQATTKQAEDARDVSSPGLRGAPLDDRPVSVTNASGVAQLRRSRDQGLSALADVRKFLGGHGRQLPPGTDFGPGQQQQGLLTGELPVGDAPSSSPQPKGQCLAFDANREDDSFGSVPKVQAEHHNHLLSSDARMVDAQRSASASELRASMVYDLVHCGPRRRFVVLGEQGPLVVHNCENVVQAVSRDILRDALLRLKGYPLYGTVVHVHDSIACEVDKGVGSVDEFCRQMAVVPPWAHGLPIAVEGYRAGHFKG